MPSARRVNWAKFRVSVVCFAAAVILVVLFYLLTGGTLFEEKAALFLYLPDATGLDQGSPVRVDGIGVGKVRSVALSGSNQPDRVIRVVLTVARDYLASIPADSYAQLSSDSLIGDKFVDITSGRAAVSMRRDAELTFKAQADMMKSLDLVQFAQQLRVVDALITDIEQGRGRVGQFVLGEDVYRELTQKVADLHKGLQEATSKTTAFGQALYTDALYRKVADPVAAFDQSLARLQSGQGPLGRLLKDPAQYEQFRSGAEDLRRAIGGLRSSELMQSDAMYDQWVRSLISLIRGVDDFNAGPLLTSRQPYDSYNGMARELRDTLRDLRSDPRKYLRLKLF